MTGSSLVEGRPSTSSSSHSSSSSSSSSSPPSACPFSSSSSSCSSASSSTSKKKSRHSGSSHSSSSSSPPSSSSSAPSSSSSSSSPTSCSPSSSSSSSSSATTPAYMARSNRLICEAEGPRYTNSACYAGAYLSSSFPSAAACVEDIFSLEKLQERTKIKFLQLSADRVVFELKGLDAAIPNALRRILISEVPTVAIETVQIWQNTGVMQDEVLAHRLGLIPFRVDPSAIDYRQPNAQWTDENSLRVSLHVKCTEKSLAPHQYSLPVYARDIVWEPMSQAQKEAFAHCPPAPVHPDILITKLRPGQEIELKAYLEKGVGKTHAKWSPVCTAVYRLEPEILLKRPFRGDEAEELCSLCPMGVFDIEDASGEAYVRYPRNCTTCRACIERFPKEVVLQKIKDHFIFSIESTGAVPAPILFKMALEVLKEKAITFSHIIDCKLESAE